MWGTCLGFELLCVLASGLKNEELLESCDAENYSIPLEFTRGKTITSNYSNIFLQYNTTAELHYWLSRIRLIVFPRVFLLQDVTRLRVIENTDFMKHQSTD